MLSGMIVQKEILLSGIRGKGGIAARVMILEPASFKKGCVSSQVIHCSFQTPASRHVASVQDTCFSASWFPEKLWLSAVSQA